MTTIRFTRRDQSDDATETLTLVRIDGSGDLAVQIERGTPEALGDFVGLYDIDGEQLQLGNATWEIVTAQEFVGDDARKIARTLELDTAWREDEDPHLDAADVAEALRCSWECGTSVCEAA